MTGRYKVLLHLDSAKSRNGDFRACWHRLINLCQSLDRDGLSYEVQFSLGEFPHAIVSASGTAKPQKIRRARAAIIPLALSMEQVQKRMIAARQALVPSPGPCWNHSQQEWRKGPKRQRVIGRVIARMKAQSRTTLNDSDIRHVRAAIGGWIALTPEGLLEAARSQHKAFRPYVPPQPAARLMRLADFAEYSHWREMARLLAERRAA